MSLGIGALGVGGGMVQSRQSMEVSLTTLQAGTTPAAATQPFTVTLKGIQ